MTFEAWLQARGIDPATLTAGPTRTALEAAFKAEPTPPPPPVPPTPPRTPDTLDDVLAQARQDNERQRQITEIVARAITEAGGNTAAIDTFERIGRLAIQGKWAVDRTELEILRAGRPAVPNVFAPSKPQASALVLEAAVCAAGGLKTLEKDYDAATLEAAHRQFKGGIGLQELILHCARSNGYREATVARDLKAALRTAFTGQDLRASGGASTLDISGILSNVANKFVREAWMFVESTWSKITAKRNVSDFKEITSYTLTGDLTYDKVAPGGEIKHGTLGEQSYTNQADTYAKLIGIDRRDLINDDLGALTQVGRRLGRGGALKLNDVFWTEFLADASTFYTAARGNYDDGAADTLMDLTGIANAHTLFMTLNDPDGKPTGTTPAIVLVPPALWPAAWTLLMSAALNLATSSAASTGTENPWKGMFRLETSRYLSNASFTGYSAAAWYLLADPSDLPVIETCFLNGVELPTVESADMDFDRLGVALRAYHDFGANKQEYRGGVKMKGAA